MRNEPPIERRSATVTPRTSKTPSTAGCSGSWINQIPRRIDLTVTAERTFDQAIDALGANRSQRHALKTYDRILERQLAIEMDDGSRRTFTAYRVQHSNDLGPYKGGFRFHPGLEISTLAELASLMTWKASLAGLPFGGAKGGIRVDPEQLSRRALRRLTEAYVQAFREAIGPDTDIMAPDLNTNDALLCLGVDILIPAAIGGVITAGNADRVRAHVIVEGANGPVSGMADVCLQQRGIRVVPDVLANCGGGVGSYIEWRQNRRDTEWSDDQVLRMFLECLHNTYSRVHQTMTERSVPMRLA